MFDIEKEDIVRENRLWVIITEDGVFEKLTLPEIYNEEILENTSHSVMWYYHMTSDKQEHIQYSRILNADDIKPMELLNLIPDITNNRELVDTVL